VVNYITYDQNLRLIFREFYIHKEKTVQKPEIKKAVSVNT